MLSKFSSHPASHFLPTLWKLSGIFQIVSYNLNFLIEHHPIKEMSEQMLFQSSPEMSWFTDFWFSHRQEAY